MTKQEIFRKLLGYKQTSVRGDDMLDEYFDTILSSVARVLGLNEEQIAALGPAGSPAATTAPANREDAILATPRQQRVEVGRKVEDGETVYSFIEVYGNASLGYIASSETWFSPNRAGGNDPEFDVVNFQTPIYPDAGAAVADAMPRAVAEAQAQRFTLAGEPATTAPALNPAEYEITSGYVGALGKTYKTATEETLWPAIAAAAARNEKSSAEIVELLQTGQPVAWGESPNYFYDHSLAIIRKKRTAPAPDLVLCDCGHRVPRAQVMRASLGTACPDCYDKLSD